MAIAKAHFRPQAALASTRLAPSGSLAVPSLIYIVRQTLTEGLQQQQQQQRRLCAKSGHREGESERQTDRQTDSPADGGH